MRRQYEKDSGRRAAARAAAVCAAALGLATIAHAAEVVESSAAHVLAFEGTAVSEAELSGRRGGASTQNDMRLDGVVGSNQASNVITGANTISSGSLAGTAGLPVVIQNSGNNVLIQNATIVNVQIK